MKIAIDSVFYPISKNLSSHRASWAKYWKYYLLNMHGSGTQVDILYRNDHDKWKEYDEIYLYHGMEFNGSLNIAGGIGDWHIKRFKAFAEFMNNKPDNIEVMSIDHEMPDYYELLKKRKIDIPELAGTIRKISKVELPKWSNQIIIGDSHSLSAMNPISNDFVRVYRNDFKTLNGVLNDGLEKYGDLSHSKYASFYFGSIDIRHHALRHGPMKDTVHNLTSRYYDQLKKISEKGIKIEVISLLPQPSDDRKLPKSGYYDGTPFYGTLQERQEAINFFNDKMKVICEYEKWDFFEWPKEFLNEDGILKKDYLEKPRSVHLAQTSYRYDFENMKVRYA